MRVYTEDLIALVQFSAEVGWSSCQDEGDEDPLSVLPSDNVKSQACGAPVDQNSTWVPGEEDTVTVVRKRSPQTKLTRDTGLTPAAK